MATREAFIQELEGLNQELNAMSQMVQDAIDSSFQALTEHNEELAQKVIKTVQVVTICWYFCSRL